MLSEGHMGAPLYHYTGQVGPRFGNSMSLVECKNGAIMSRLRLISTSTAIHILIRCIQSVRAFGMLSQGHMVAPLYRYTGQVGLRFGDSGSFVE